VRTIVCQKCIFLLIIQFTIVPLIQLVTSCGRGAAQCLYCRLIIIICTQQQQQAVVSEGNKLLLCTQCHDGSLPTITLLFFDEFIINWIHWGFSRLAFLYSIDVCRFCSSNNLHGVIKT
jgi:hypothetical protein